MKRKISFTKMHGTGNDYIYLDCLKRNVELSPDEVIRLSDRHFGIGGDGVVMIMPSSVADFRMRMFNADGSEAEMCGNAVRCIAKYVFDKGITDKQTLELETKGGIKRLALCVQQGKVQSVRVDMGEPILEAAEIPVNLSLPRVVNEAFSVEGHEFRMTCVSMGNPHAVFFVDEITDELVLGLGPKIERHELFPKRVNVEFVRLLEKDLVEMRVWERGSGETLSCGTGASAVGVACVLNGITSRSLRVCVLGGELQIEWAEDNHVYKTGPATFVFEGEVEI